MTDPESHRFHPPPRDGTPSPNYYSWQQAQNAEPARQPEEELPAPKRSWWQRLLGKS